jgi:hypothetical protein
MTAKINLVREVEASLALALGNDAKGVVDLSTSDMLTVVGTLAGVLIIDGMMILGLARTSKTLKTYKLNKRTKKKGITNSWIIRLITGIIDMNFIYQILTSVLGSGIGLVVISWLLLKDQIAVSQSSAATLENMYLQRYFSNYIHEVQKERGATGVYMGSSGKNFVTELANQKLLTDLKRLDYDKFLEEYVDFGNLNDYSAWVELRQDYFAFLIENRQQSSKLAIPASTSLGFYTKHNGKIVDITGEIARRASGDSIESRLLALLGFMYMKEKAGNERAVGSVGFSSNGWGGLANFQKFISLVSFQTASSTFFYTFGTADQIDMFEATAFLKGSRVSSEMREKGLTGLEAQMKAVDGGQWYGNITQKIDAWRLVEVRIADDLEVFFSALDNMVDNFLIGIVIMLVTLLIVSIWVVWKGIRLVLNSRAYINYQERMAYDRNNKGGKVASSEVKGDAKSVAV